MRKIYVFLISAIIVLLLATIVASSSSSTDWYDTDWFYSKKITIDHTQVDATLTDFPVLINITDIGLMGHAQDDGDDILFTMDNVTKLFHEIEYFDSSTGYLAAWVKIPSLSHSVDTELYMYYGNSACSNQQNPLGVWDNGFEAVYHMGDADDSLGNHDAINNGVSFVPGHIGNCGDFVRAEGDYFNLAPIVLQDFDKTVTFYNKFDDGTANNYIFGFLSYGGVYLSYNTHIDGYFFLHYNRPSGYTVAKTSENAGERWNYVTAVHNAATNYLYIYVDGILKASKSIGKEELDKNGLDTIGFSGSTHHLDACIDEFRISKTARSVDWIKTEFNNLNNASDGGFFRVNAKENNILPDWYNNEWIYSKKITIDHNQVEETLVNFPVLINITDVDLRDHAQNDGDDILFTMNNVTKLNHEIEEYNSTLGHLIAWVNIPLLSDIYDTNIYMYFGNQICSSQENVAGTWDSNYVLVNHLNDASDSTGNYDGTNFGASFVSGKVGDCGDFEDTENDRILYGDIDELDGASKVTVSCWAKAERLLDASYDRYNCLWGEFTSEGSCFRAGGLGEHVHRFIISMGGTYGFKNGIFFEGNWYHFSVRYDGDESTDAGKLRLFKNGREQMLTYRSGHPIPSQLSDDNAIFKSGTDGDEWTNYDGLLDELRISNIDRSVGWIKTTYNTMNNDSDGGFFKVGEIKGAKLPVADFEYTPENPGIDVDIQFNDLSYSNDGAIVSWWWNFDDGFYSDLQNPMYSYNAKGIYDVTLTVTDDMGLANTTTKTIYIGYIAPIAWPTVDNDVKTDSDGDGFESFTFDGVDSFDPDGTITAYEWTNDTTILSTSISFTDDFSVGEHTMDLTVTDNDGLTDNDTVTITVLSQPANVLPVADAGDDQTVVDNDDNGFETVTLDGSGSYDTDGTIVSYEWTYNSGVIGNTETFDYDFNIGTHNVELNLTDDRGGFDLDMIQITVNEKPPIQEIWSDDFGTNDFSKWTYYPNGGSGWKVISEQAVSERSHSKIYKTLDLSGYESVNVSFRKSLANTLEGNDYLECWIYKTYWNKIRLARWTGNDPSGWTNEKFAIPADYLVSGFRLEFYSVTDWLFEKTYLDDVLLEGKEIR